MNTKTTQVMVILLSIVILVVTNQAMAQTPTYVPILFKIVLDASGSISIPNFRIENQNIARFAETLYQLAQAHQGEYADLLSVSWFGGVTMRDEYQSTRFINCSKILDIAFLSEMLENLNHPKYGNTEIYSAIVKATSEMIETDKQLRGNYFKLLVVVTDGADTNSPTDIKQFVSEIYPNDGKILLFVVGVGDKARINDFQWIANNVDQIDNFDQLSARLLLIRELVSGLGE